MESEEIGVSDKNTSGVDDDANGVDPNGLRVNPNGPQVDPNGPRVDANGVDADGVDANGFGDTDTDGLWDANADGLGDTGADGLGDTDADRLGDADADGLGDAGADGLGGAKTDGLGGDNADGLGDANADGLGDYARHMSKRIGDDKEKLTASECLEELRREAVLAQQGVVQGTPNPTLQLLGDRFKLREAKEQLTKEAKKSDLDVIVRGRVAAMIGLLNIYADENLGYTWRKASEVMAKAQGRGMNLARHIREWVLGFLKWRDLPLHQLNWKRWTILDDEDIAEEIKARMMEKVKGGFLKAEDVVEIVASQEIQAIFAQKGITKVSISVKTALRWLEKLGWTYGKLKNGMYLDGHERLDVVEYREHFVGRWMEHERRFHRWDHDGSELPRPNGFPVPCANGRFRLILVTHDESTFFQNDERNTGWSHAASKSKPKPKGNGQSLMVSDFLTSDWGRLRDGDE